MTTMVKEQKTEREKKKDFRGVLMRFLFFYLLRMHRVW